MSKWQRQLERDRGSATVWLVGACAAIASFSLVVLYGTGAVLARHRAQAAADLGALAAAARVVAGAAAACADARAVVASNGATIVGCRIDGVDAIVTATVRVSGAPPGIGAASATARAGPVATTAVGDPLASRAGLSAK